MPEMKPDYRPQESTKDYDIVRRTTCTNQCESGCGMKIFLKEGRIVDIMGDETHPLSRGGLCSKGSSQFQRYYDPLRVHYPQIRKSLDDPYRRVSWDDAIDFVAERLTLLKQRYGPESLAIFRTGRASMGQKVGGGRFGHFFGTPNIFGQGPICCESPGAAMNYVFGAEGFGRLMNPSPDWKNAQCILMVGTEMASQEVITFRGILDAKEAGAKIIGVDTRFNSSMSKADLFLMVRNNTDTALFMAMANIIIQEGLYDKKFVDKWVYGFEEYKEACREWTPEKAERVTMVDRNLIIKAARLFATSKPAMATGCLGTAQQYNSNNTNRAIAALLALTGNIGIKGGGWNWLHNTRPPLSYGSDTHDLPEPRRPIIADNLLPWGDNSVPVIINAMLHGKPYPIRGLIWNGNHLPQFPNVTKTERALRNNLITVHLSIYPNHTYHFAHASFPIAMGMETESICHHGNNRLIQWHNKVIAYQHEHRPDLFFYAKLAKKLGFGDKFPWLTDNDTDVNEKEFTNWMLREDHMTRGISSFNLDPEHNPPGGIMWPAETEQEATYQDPEATLRGKWIMYQEGDPYPGTDSRFPTPSTKIELASAALEKLGWDRVPRHREASESWIANPSRAAKYPISLNTCRMTSSFHEGGHWWPWADELVPDRYIQIHPELAGILGIEDGDTVVLENDRGSIDGPAWVTEMVPPWGCWVNFGFDRYQPFHPYETVNVVIDDIIKDPVYGQIQWKSMAVRVYRKGAQGSEAASKVLRYLQAKYPNLFNAEGVLLGAYKDRNWDYEERESWIDPFAPVMATAGSKAAD